MNPNFLSPEGPTLYYNRRWHVPGQSPALLTDPLNEFSLFDYLFDRLFEPLNEFRQSWHHA